MKALSCAMVTKISTLKLQITKPQYLNNGSTVEPPHKLPQFFMSRLYQVASWKSKTAYFPRLTDVRAPLTDDKTLCADDKSPFMHFSKRKSKQHCLA